MNDNKKLKAIGGITIPPGWYWQLVNRNEVVPYELKQPLRVRVGTHPRTGATIYNPKTTTGKTIWGITLFDGLFDPYAFPFMRHVALMYERCLGYLPDKTIGDTLYCTAGAPGVGHSVYQITRFDNNGECWGVLVEDTITMLEPEDVR